MLALLYGGTELYWQPQTGKSWRVRLARQNVPCAMPVPRILAKPPLIFLRELELPLDLDEAGIHALTAATGSPETSRAGGGDGGHDLDPGVPPGAPPRSGRREAVGISIP